ncbi:60S ribosomal protein L14E/L6E/L27E [Encephalitozoon intestinalis ATCC 50506]|uniref:60S ribosomal protein L14E/L6E/L27E n=1 Tax=Encephalitozoon intestinalis (strain ATCC 50506) TaxID=876142 RepID=E0S6I3_ENCIT|nr:60S ribosomal protein L14E/L6E/L27E [Encephalitozoon intestinalis ATCC 50506]ADM11318.1 60S ribosomal protein L14E/L6E/L27E [Encephalitozoon intestinalis ATCC 50506]UTX45004.1 ribosomal protein L14E/L6E/L27E [Encephalitozoon intestinalis]
MLFVPNMIVVVTNGKNAGKKAVVIKQLDERCVLTACVVRVPKESEDHQPKWIQRRNAKFYIILKKYNISHLIATRYKADLGLAAIDYNGIEENAETKKVLTDKTKDAMMKTWKEGKAKFLFSSLSF